MVVSRFTRITAGQVYTSLTPTFGDVVARTLSKVALPYNVRYIVTMEKTEHTAEKDAHVERRHHDRDCETAPDSKCHCAPSVVTSVEPGCTCGGVAACQQCQDRDAVKDVGDRLITHGLAAALGGLIEDQLQSIEERHQAVVRRLAAVEVMAERAARKGYDLDPHEVLACVTPPVREGQP